MGPTLASATMSWNIWLPFCISVGLLTCAIPTIMFVPEMHKSALVGPEAGIYQRSLDVDVEEAGPLLGDSESSLSRYANAFEKPRGFVQETLQVVRKLASLIRGRSNFQILLYSFFLTALASSDTKLLVQYISKRYEWTFAQVCFIDQNIAHALIRTQAGFMLSAKAIVNFTLLAIIVPRIIRKSMLTTAAHGSEVRLNVIGAEASILVSVVGVLGVALALKFWMLLLALMIYALGSALPVFTMSLVKSQLITHGDSDTQDFSIIMLTKTLGSLVGAPLMASLWIKALKLGGIALGLPYLVSAVSSPALGHKIFCIDLSQTIYIAAALVVARPRF